jgi:hypothetical protein
LYPGQNAITLQVALQAMSDIEQAAGGDSDTDIDDVQQSACKNVGGRTRFHIRSQFEQLHRSEKNTSKAPVKCKQCAQEFKDPRVAYLTKHILHRCNNVPVDIRKRAIDSTASRAGSTSSLTQSTLGPGGNAPGAAGHQFNAADLVAAMTVQLDQQ